MNLSRRLALLEWSREAHAWIVEDDYDSEYRFSGRPLEALHGLDRAGRVLYIGTLSKVLFPSLRLGYLVAPPELLDGLVAAQRLIAVHVRVHFHRRHLHLRRGERCGEHEKERQVLHQLHCDIRHTFV